MMGKVGGTGHNGWNFLALDGTLRGSVMVRVGQLAGSHHKRCADHCSGGCGAVAINIAISGVKQVFSA
jgi:hypothetical protein